MGTFSDARVGDQVWLSGDTGLSFGSVRAIDTRNRTLQVWIEGHGEVTLEASAVQAVHDHKVEIDGGRLSTTLHAAISQAHDREVE